MVELAKALEIAEELRQEPYHLLQNDCITKSVRLKRACADLGIPAKVTVCLGLAQARLLGRRVTIPVIHAWAEVANRRVETSRPLGSSGTWGIVPVNIRPVVTWRF